VKQFWSVPNLAAAMHARVLSRGEGEASARKVSTDSRCVRAGEVFFALRGERFDAHAFLQQAVDARAGVVVVDREEACATLVRAHHTAVLLVRETGRALLDLAYAYRSTLTRTRVIAVGGSNGKTTTVRLLQAALAGSRRGSASPKSFNNAIGVPLTLLGAELDDEYVICEVGTNAPGELALLAPVVAPDIAILTSLGREHLEGLGSLEGVAREEASLLLGLRSGGVALVCDDDRLVAAARRVVAPGASTLLTFGARATSDVRVRAVRQRLEGLRFEVASVGHPVRAFELPVLGSHNAVNACGAIAAARLLGVEDGAIAQGLTQRLVPAGMRLELTTIPLARGPVRILNDAYNANPESMLAAIVTVQELVDQLSPPPRRVLVLGDMLEQGVHAPALHAEIGREIAQQRWADLVVLVGAHMEQAAEPIRAALGSSAVLRVPVLDSVTLPHIAALVREHDLVLLKGSRGMQLERVAGAIAARATAQAPHDTLSQVRPQGVSVTSGAITP
jgi:UDP-N-acetylmuramoyl-tripeptide--D-alanyl-D-alanine ligase